MSMYFDIPLFELPSLAGRLSDYQLPLILGVQYVCARGCWKELCYPRKKTCISMFDWLCDAQRIRTSFTV